MASRSIMVMGKTQNHAINSREDKIMSKRITTKRNIKRFTDQCFDRESEKAARIIKGILDARSSRISDIADAMEGNYDANYKAIQRFIEDDTHRR